MTEMTRILDLVRSGKLTEATESIQRNLRGDAPDPADRPMRDVTPTARALPGPGTGKAGKATRPKRNRAAGAAMTRHDGAVPYRIFTPHTPATDTPLIVMLHGCTQTPEDFAAGTRMNVAADAIGAHVLWPEQVRAANMNGCWNWFEPSHQGRSGEAAAIVATVADTLSRIGGGRRVCVAGLSAGGAMSAILGARYPDVFAAVGIHSGLPVGSARDVTSAFGAMRSGGQGTADVQTPLIAFHGMADRTVDPRNALPFVPRDPAAVRTEVMSGGRRCTVIRAPGAEVWEVDGLGHAWSGGDARGSFADPKGPDASAEMLRFFTEL
ncbi:extracellular catalytic domain type 1 short-chain-length polyhydroxyalkanoate depolymerase [Jannaschia donghaensis]|uniref:Esterase, PHB depolymerase family n=1 Tax=Jannaschia donghaensis TaxID=420998 RepID=A0A0M6YFQ3_9RHOB|nr:PHB depolymerase family esterase [Jannaschia donghaensis]CTQ49191.1 esterase, PHB depolymerase family [Jannaschia donghaensis]